MLSNWVVQCVFQKNKKTRQSVKVSSGFMVLPCLSESVFLMLSFFSVTVGGVACRQG